jgi:sulfide:quinone oxidoreductase
MAATTGHRDPENADGGPRHVSTASPSPRRPDSELSRLEVVIAGGGVAALETALALRVMAGDRVALTFISPRTDFVVTPLAVGAPFAVTHAPSWPLADIACELGAHHVAAALTYVDAHAHRVQLSDGTELDYQALMLALGARRYPPFRHARTFFAEDAPGLLGGLVADLEQGWSKSVAFVVPPRVEWTLPAYELALLTARDVNAMGIDDAQITIVTPEERPLALFGPAAGTAVAELLTEARVAIECGAHVESVSAGSLSLGAHRRPLHAERVVALPLLEGRRIGGLPHDARGFLPIDQHAAVRGVEDVFAAGDGTDFPVKQGGIGTQQADAAAERIAAEAGADVTPQPFRPVLRGWLLTGEARRYFANPLVPGGGTGATSLEPLWWPPTKIAGRYVGPWLATHERRPHATASAAMYTP